MTKEEQEEEDKETMTNTDSDLMLKGCKERMIDLTRISLLEELYYKWLKCYLKRKKDWGDTFPISQQFFIL